MTEQPVQRKLAAILAADVVGFSRMMGDHENRTLQNLKACRILTDQSIEAYHGRIFGSAGDSVIAEFASPVNAIVAAVAFQKSLQERNYDVPPEGRMQFRVGLNLGDVIVEGDNLYGDGVNIAARLEATAEPGGICVSGKFHDEVRRKLDLIFVSLGAQEMKNIDEPVPTFMVEIESAFNILETFAPPSPVQETDYIEISKTKAPAIAVLPFTNMSGDPEQEYFADGITEDIINNLALWRTFPVISRNSTFTFRGQSQNLKNVATELGARYIVEGSVRKGGKRVRITAQLVDAKEDHQLWSERWDRTLEDIFDVQDEVSEAISRRVSPSVTGYEQNRLIRQRPDNLSAWEEYLQGLRCFHERQHTDHEDRGLTQARRHFEKAIELDPALSDAHAYLSICGAWELIYFTVEDPEQTLTAMLADGRKAEALNPENPLALTGMATAYLLRGDHSAAQTHALRAVKFNPSLALSYLWLGGAQVHSGDYEQGENTILKAFELSPADPELNIFYAVLYFSCLGQGKYAEALDAIEQALLQHPDAGHHLGFRAAALGHLERSTEATAALDRYLTLRPNLKTRDDYRRIFIPNSTLADPIIEGLVKAGWQPEE